MFALDIDNSFRLGDKIVDYHNDKKLRKIRNVLQLYSKNAMAIIDEEGVVYPITNRVHETAREELIRLHKNKDEVVVGFYRDKACYFYNAKKDDRTYSAICLTEKQMRALYNITLVYCEDIVEDFKNNSGNLGLSYDEQHIEDIVGFLEESQRNKIYEDLRIARENNLKQLNIVANISRAEMQR